MKPLVTKPTKVSDIEPGETYVNHDSTRVLTVLSITTNNHHKYTVKLQMLVVDRVNKTTVIVTNLYRPSDTIHVFKLEE